LKLTPECIPCLLKRLLFETDADPGLDPGRREEIKRRIIEGSLDIIREVGLEAPSPILARRVHRLAYDLIGSDDPYIRLKRTAQEAALALVDEARAYVEGHHDRLEATLRLAVVGNLIDFGIEGSIKDASDFSGRFRQLLDREVRFDDIAEFRQLLDRGRAATGVVEVGPGDIEGCQVTIPYILDNCGEVVMDRFLVDHLRTLGFQVLVVAKGDPILTDATVEDAREAGLEELATIVDNGGFGIGFDLEDPPTELLDRLREAPFIIAKGMANYEALTELDIGPVVFLMHTKCAAVANSINMPLDRGVLRVWRP